MTEELKETLRREYALGLSSRQLAKKYHISKNTVLRCVHEGWRQGSRRQSPPAAPAPCPDGDYALLRQRALQVMNKADDLLSLDEPLAPRDLKSLSSMLLDVRQLLGILSPREAAEQEIRLIMLRKQAQADERKHEDVTVRFVDTDGAEA